MAKLGSKKVAILTHNYFEQAEFEEPLEALRKAGAQVDVVSADGKNLRGMRHTDKGKAFTADLLLEEADPEAYDAVVLPGGVMNADHLRMNEVAQEFVNVMYEDGKLVAAICHAPWLLTSSGMVRGVTLTSYYTLQDDIRNAGGIWEDSKVVISDNLITSRNPDDLPAFNRAIIEYLSEEDQ